MIDLTSRQIQILRSVIEEYLETAEPVGSDTIDKKFNLGVSPATIRNEMAYLSDQGYLKQPHTSSGRVPTASALKLYVKELMNKKNLSVADEVSVKERIWENRNDVETLLRESAKLLADRTKAVGIAITDDHQSFHSGYSHLFNSAEFENLDLNRTLFSLLEETRQLEAIFSRGWGDDVVHVVFGEDLGNVYLEPVSIMFTEVICDNQHASLGVIGPSTLDYQHVVSILEYLHDLMQGIQTKK
jgi:transcriptional regulator of heat shock response